MWPFAGDGSERLEAGIRCPFRQGHDFVPGAELPGVVKASLDVQVKGRQVHICGTKALDFADGVSVHRRKRRSGAFNRALAIPADIDPDAVKAGYRDGVLAVRLPRAESDPPGCRLRRGVPARDRA